MPHPARGDPPGRPGSYCGVQNVGDVSLAAGAQVLGEHDALDLEDPPAQSHPVPARLRPLERSARICFFSDRGGNPGRSGLGQHVRLNERRLLQQFHLVEQALPTDPEQVGHRHCHPFFGQHGMDPGP